MVSEHGIEVTAFFQSSVLGSAVAARSMSGSDHRAVSDVCAPAIAVNLNHQNRRNSSGARAMITLSLCKWWFMWLKNRLFIAPSGRHALGLMKARRGYVASPAPPTWTVAVFDCAPNPYHRLGML